MLPPNRRQIQRILPLFATLQQFPTFAKSSRGYISNWLYLIIIHLVYFLSFEIGGAAHCVPGKQVIEYYTLLLVHIESVSGEF